MTIFKIIFFACISTILFSCAASNKKYSPTKKYPKASLQKDFTLLQNILTKKHPAMYWYTPKPKMDDYFKKYYADIKDSMTEQDFAWHIIAPMVDKIHCGHTSMSMSNAYSKWAKGKIIPSFPLYFKIWNDTLAVTGNLNAAKDSIFKRGTIVTSINDIPNKLLIKYMMEFLPEDGYATNVNYIRLSGNFPFLHRNIFGLSKNYTVGYIDNEGVDRKTTLPLFIPKVDTIKKDTLPIMKVPKISKKQRQMRYRSLLIDSTQKFATLTLNTFSNGHLRAFFRRSFKQLQQKKVNNLILDIRVNGGGRVGLSTLLTKYISHTNFKVADSLYSPIRNISPYSKYIKGGFLNNIEMAVISHKKKDGNYHIGYLEKHVYKPKKNNYKGKVYVLISGPTFSASALFCNAVKGQKNITLVGEETGGGWYGNSGIMIPDITLPHTGVKVRLPLYKLVQYNHIKEKGTGILPDVFVPTSYDALMKGYDKKMEVVKKLLGAE